MFEGLLQPIHLLFIFGIALLVFGPRNFRSWAKESERASAASRQP
jgi:Sec-independent protein translocase protein TatA